MVIILFTALLAGCATQGVNTQRYDPPSVVKVNNEIKIQKPQMEVWDTLVRELAKSFYVINNIDKASRIINVSFSSTQPEVYIDCGMAHRTYAQGEKQEIFDYETAASSEFKHAASQQAHPAFAYYYLVQRKTDLDGRTNIYLAPDEKNPNGTIVSVNTRYVIGIKIRGGLYSEHVSGNTRFLRPLPENVSKISFNTNGYGEQRSKDGRVIRCVSRGKLEKDILDMALGQKKQ